MHACRGLHPFQANASRLNVHLPVHHRARRVVCHAVCASAEAPPLEFVIRRAGRQDVGAMAAMDGGGATWTADSIYPSPFVWLQAETVQPLATLLVAVPAAPAPTHPPTPVLGWVCAWDIAAERQLDLMMLSVHAAARRRGVATALLRALADRHPRRRRAVLEVAAGNRGARAFYAAQGAVEVGRRRGYYADGGDALVLRLPLPPPGAPGTRERAGQA
ncbi:hypothetical protein ACKKBG_A31210 [Auxenochlorella protothecoides x Auxenochlorella symbiontica]